MICSIDLPSFAPHTLLLFIGQSNWGNIMLPKVILHAAMSLDGRIANFPADLETYYTLALQWSPDAVLFGSETVLAAVKDNPSLEVPAEHEEMFRPPEGMPDPRPLIVIADSRGRVDCWEAMAKWPYMRGLLAFCSESTPQEYLDRLQERHVGTIIAGRERIDFRTALDTLNQEYGVKVVRVDSGGTLNSVLLHAGLVSEVSVLIHPIIAGGKADPTLSDPLKAGIMDLQVPLTLKSTEIVGDGLIWARYDVPKAESIIDR